MSQESSEHLAVNLNLKESKSRLFGCLERILTVSGEKFNMQKASNADRQKWGRLIVSCVEAYGRLLETAQLEALEERLTRLETGR